MSPFNASFRFAQHAGAFVRRSWRRAVQQERMLATTAFALIASTTLAGLDFVVTGGAPDWNPGGEAYAQEALLVTHRAEVPPAVKIDLPAPVPRVETTRADHSVTAETLLGAPDLELWEQAGASAPRGFVPASAKPFAANRL